MVWGEDCGRSEVKEVGIGQLEIDGQGLPVGPIQRA